ncbi:amine-terminal region of a tm vesicle-mediated sorter, partial [Cystoisospora suis]
MSRVVRRSTVGCHPGVQDAPAGALRPKSRVYRRLKSECASARNSPGFDGNSCEPVEAAPSSRFSHPPGSFRQTNQSRSWFLSGALGARQGWSAGRSMCGSPRSGPEEKHSRFVRADSRDAAELRRLVLPSNRSWKRQQREQFIRASALELLTKTTGGGDLAGDLVSMEIFWYLFNLATALGARPLLPVPAFQRLASCPSSNVAAYAFPAYTVEFVERGMPSLQSLLSGGPGVEPPPGHVPVNHSSHTLPLVPGPGDSSLRSQVSRWLPRPLSQPDVTIHCPVPPKAPPNRPRLYSIRQDLFGRSSSTTCVERKQRGVGKEQKRRSTLVPVGLSEGREDPGRRATTPNLFTIDGFESDVESKGIPENREGRKDEATSLLSRFSFRSLSWRSEAPRRDSRQIVCPEEGREEREPFVPLGEFVSAISLSDEDEVDNERTPLAWCNRNPRVLDRQQSKRCGISTSEGKRERLRRLLTGDVATDTGGDSGDSLQNIGDGNLFDAPGDPHACLRAVIDGPVQRVVALAVTVYGKTRDFLSESDPLFFEIGIEPPLQVGNRLLDPVKVSLLEPSGGGVATNFLGFTSKAEDKGVFQRLGSIARFGTSSVRRHFESHATWKHHSDSACTGAKKPHLPLLTGPARLASLAAPFLSSISCSYGLGGGNRTLGRSLSGPRSLATKSSPNETYHSLSAVLQPGEDIATEESCTALTVELSVVSAKHPYRHEYQSKPFALDSLLSRGTTVSNGNITLYRTGIVDESDTPVESEHPLFGVLMNTAPPEMVICLEAATGSVSLGDSATAEGSMLDRATGGSPPSKARQHRRSYWGSEAARSWQALGSCPDSGRGSRQTPLSNKGYAAHSVFSRDNWNEAERWGREREKTSTSSAIASSTLLSHTGDPSWEKAQPDVVDQARDKMPSLVTAGLPSGSVPLLRPASRRHISAAVQAAWDSGSETNLRTFVWQTSVRTIKLFAPFWLVNRHPAPLLVVQPQMGMPLRVDCTDWRALSCGHSDDKLSLRLGLGESLDLEESRSSEDLVDGSATSCNAASWPTKQVIKGSSSDTNSHEVEEVKVVSNSTDGDRVDGTTDAQQDTTASSHEAASSSPASSALVAQSLSPVFRVDVVGRVSQVVIPSGDAHGGISWRVLRGGCRNPRKIPGSSQKKQLRPHWLGVIVSLAPPPFVRTKVVNVFSRFTLVNSLPSDIWISEGGSLAPGGVAPTAQGSPRGGNDSDSDTQPSKLPQGLIRLQAGKKVTFHPQGYRSGAPSIVFALAHHHLQKPPRGTAKRQEVGKSSLCKTANPGTLKTEGSFSNELNKMAASRASSQRPSRTTKPEGARIASRDTSDTSGNAQLGGGAQKAQLGSSADCGDRSTSSLSLSVPIVSSNATEGELKADLSEAELGEGRSVAVISQSRPSCHMDTGGGIARGTRAGHQESSALSDGLPTSWSSDISINRVSRFQIRLRSPWRHDLWQRADCAHIAEGSPSEECEHIGSSGRSGRSQRGSSLLDSATATRGGAASTENLRGGVEGAPTLFVSGRSSSAALEDDGRQEQSTCCIVGYRRSFCIVEVEIRSVEDAALFVCFSKPKRAEFLLVNQTRRVVQFSQTGSGLKHRADKDFLLPGERCDFAWQEPQRSRRVMRFTIVEKGQVYSRNCEIERVKQHRCLQLPPLQSTNGGGGSSKGGDRVYFVTDVHQGRRIVIISEAYPRVTAAVTLGHLDGLPSQLRGCSEYAVPLWGHHPDDVACCGRVSSENGYGSYGPPKPNSTLASTWRSLHREVSLLKPFSLISRRITNCVVPRASAAARAPFPFVTQLATRSRKDDSCDGVGTSFACPEIRMITAGSPRSKREDCPDNRRVSAPPQSGPKAYERSRLKRSASDETLTGRQPSKKPGSAASIDALRTRLETFNVLSLVSSRKVSNPNRSSHRRSEEERRSFQQRCEDPGVLGAAWSPQQTQRPYSSSGTSLQDAERGRRYTSWSSAVQEEPSRPRVGQGAEPLVWGRSVIPTKNHDSDGYGAAACRGNWKLGQVTKAHDAGVTDQNRFLQSSLWVSRRPRMYYHVPSVFLEEEERGTGPCLMVAADRRGSSCSTRTGSLERFLGQTAQQPGFCDGQVEYEKAKRLPQVEQWRRRSEERTKACSEAAAEDGEAGAGWGLLPHDDGDMSGDGSEVDSYDDSDSPSEETDDEHSTERSTDLEEQTRAKGEIVRQSRADRTTPPEHTGSPLRAATTPAAVTSFSGLPSRASRGLSLSAMSGVFRPARGSSRSMQLYCPRRTPVSRRFCSQASLFAKTGHSGSMFTLRRSLTEALVHRVRIHRTHTDKGLTSRLSFKPANGRLKDSQRRRTSVEDNNVDGDEKNNELSGTTAQNSGSDHGQGEPFIFPVNRGSPDTELAPESMEGRPSRGRALRSRRRRRRRRELPGSRGLRRSLAGSRLLQAEEHCESGQPDEGECELECLQPKPKRTPGRRSRHVSVRGGDEDGEMGRLFLWKHSRGDPYPTLGITNSPGSQTRTVECSASFPETRLSHAVRSHRCDTLAASHHDRSGQSPTASSSWFFSLVGNSSFLLQVQLKGCGISLVDDQPQELLYVGATGVEAAARRLDLWPLDYSITSIPDRRVDWAVSTLNGTGGEGGGKHAGRTDFRFTIRRLQVDNGTQGARHATVVRPCTGEELAEHQGSGAGQKTKTAATLGDGVLTARQVDSIIASSIQPYIVWNERPSGSRLRGRRLRGREIDVDEGGGAGTAGETVGGFLRVQFGGRSGREATVLQYFDCALAPISIHFEVDTTFELVQYLLGFVQLKNSYFRALQARSVKEVREAASLDPRTAGFQKFRACPSVPAARVADRKPLYIRTFCIRPIQVLISARAPRAHRRHLSSTGRDILALRQFQLVGGRMTDVTNFPMKFRLVLQRAVFSTTDQLGEALLRFYVQQGLRQVHKLVASIDIIGNPLSLFTNVSVGTKALVRDPSARDPNNPEDTGDVVRAPFWRRLSRFLTAVSAGFCGSISNLASGIFRLFEYMKLVDGDSLRSVWPASIRVTRDQGENPSNFIDGCCFGFRGATQMLLAAMVVVLVYPLRGARDGGIRGCVWGVVSGVAALLFGTIGAALTLVQCIARGIYNSLKAAQIVELVRPPRVFPADHSVQQYDFGSAQATELLRQAMPNAVATGLLQHVESTLPLGIPDGGGGQERHSTQPPATGRISAGPEEGPRVYPDRGGGRPLYPTSADLVLGVAAPSG